MMPHLKFLNRLEEIKIACETDDWIDGQGVAISKEKIDWLGGAWCHHWPETNESPFVYPTVEGKISLEWDSKDVGIEAVIDLERSQVSVMILKGPSMDSEEFFEFGLNQDADWQKMVKLIEENLKSAREPSPGILFKI